jgi:murein DD-endopeptidase MepM/ murein hydrolase activator NlpD
MSFKPLFQNFQNLSNYIKIDLSKDTLIQSKVDIQNNSDLDKYIKNHVNHDKLNIAYGGYLEKRDLYNNVEQFKTGKNQRDIHLGVDFWADAGEEILNPMDGLVHSFRDNKENGNYGPCIILKHQKDNHTFYSLYGHLNKESLEGLEVGKIIKQKEAFCQLGTPKENGGYVPHLHFQLIKDIDDYYGDYPGVCHQDDLDFFRSNTISPLKFLGL